MTKNLMIFLVLTALLALTQTVPQPGGPLPRCGPRPLHGGQQVPPPLGGSRHLHGGQQGPPPLGGPRPVDSGQQGPPPLGGSRPQALQEGQLPQGSQ
jgi:hypothetical protein